MHRTVVVGLDWLELWSLAWCPFVASTACPSVSSFPLWLSGALYFLAFLSLQPFGGPGCLKDMFWWSPDAMFCMSKCDLAKYRHSLPTHSVQTSHACEDFHTSWQTAGAWRVHIELELENVVGLFCWKNGAVLWELNGRLGDCNFLILTLSCFCIVNYHHKTLLVVMFHDMRGAFWPATVWGGFVISLWKSLMSEQKKNKSSLWNIFFPLCWWQVPKERLFHCFRQKLSLWPSCIAHQTYEFWP